MLTMPDLYLLQKFEQWTGFTLIKPCSGNYNYVANFDHTHTLKHLPTNKFDNPVVYLQHERKLWAEAHVLSHKNVQST